MRTSRRVLGLVLGWSLVATALASGEGFAAAKFRSADDALKQGISAFNGGYFEIAIPALEHAAAEDVFLAQYYLARIYADNSSAHTDHAKAYMLFQRLADDHADVDPDDDQRAPFVAKSLTALAGYVLRGLPEVGLKSDATRAAEYLHHAAVFFGNEDAQFELAKLRLKGEGVPKDASYAKHWLSVLSQKGHAGAQAFLADLYWRGKEVEKDQVRALSLIQVAVENAPAHEKVWIEDIYQNIFCGASSSIRKQATGIVADWRAKYGRKPISRDRTGLAALNAAPVRTCGDGEPVAPFDAGTVAVDAGKASAEPLKIPTAPAAGFAQGSTLGASAGGGALGTLRDVGAPDPVQR